MKWEQVLAVADAVHGAGLNETTLARLRAEFRGLHLTYCMDDDVSGVEPILRRPGMNVYLVDSRQHCLALTENLEAASGLVLAAVLDD